MQRHVDRSTDIHMRSERADRVAGTGPPRPRGMTVSVWSAHRERGSAALVRLMVWLTLGLGWPVGRALLYPITAYFFLFSRGACRASGRFLARALNRPATA